MAIVSAGYDGTVDEVQWAALAPRVGRGRYGVVGANDWKVSPHPSTAQAVNVASGVGWGWGVLDDSDAIQTVQCDPITSGTRWDMICTHRDWTPPNGATLARKITGSSAKQLPPRDSTPGVSDDQPLALVQWTAGQTQPTAIVDLRTWAGPGGVIAKDQLVLGFLGDLGTCVRVADVEWVYGLGANDVPVWSNPDAGATYAFVDNLPNYDFNGPVVVKRVSPTVREIEVAVSMIRKGNLGNPMSSEAQDMGVVLPAAAIGAGNSVIGSSPLSLVDAAAGSKSTAEVFWQLRPSDGRLFIWSPAAFTWGTERLITLNCKFRVTG
ncbi:hypothetical protein [Arthrobacter sp. NPDC090010]|uniref:hypothetical protein n=1 Tax=Arthrobacter sp. NPDC090010 TaxID=3363942 RepID=UPI003803E21F